jgi:hypothetical protein
MSIANGSIEIIKENGDNYGFPITTLYPLNTDSALASQVKGRTGVQLGAKRPYPKDEDKDFPKGILDNSEWGGTAPDGSKVTVRIWDTA